jgi:hypothetical protein
MDTLSLLINGHSSFFTRKMLIRDCFSRTSAGIDVVNGVVAKESDVDYCPLK